MLIHYYMEYNLLISILKCKYSNYMFTLLCFILTLVLDLPQINV